MGSSPSLSFGWIQVPEHGFKPNKVNCFSPIMPRLFLYFFTVKNNTVVNICVYTSFFIFRIDF